MMTASLFATIPFADGPRPAAIAVALAAAWGATWPAFPAAAATQAETAQVVREACGAEPEPACVAALRKVCHKKMTMRCYLSRKARIDAERDGDSNSPERVDERDDQSIFYDD